MSTCPAATPAQVAMHLNHRGKAVKKATRSHDVTAIQHALATAVGVEASNRDAIQRRYRELLNRG